MRELEEQVQRQERERIAREQQERERDNLARREQQERERIIARVRELEEQIRQKDQSLQRLSGEIKNLNKQLNFEKKKNSSQLNNVINYSNIPKQIKKIFKNDKIPVLKKNENQ